MALLEIKDLVVEVEGKEIIKGLNLKLEKGKVNVLMGPNGSGKSTLSNIIMGHPKYKIKSGMILYEGNDLSELKPNERSLKGIFLSFQYPHEIPGVTMSSFLRSIVNARRKEKIPLKEFRDKAKELLEKLKMDSSFLRRYVNEGFSGGEKKRAEILQLMMLNPELAILDETDSGLDIDALKVVSEGINSYIDEDKCILLITHYKRILDYIKPDKIFIMKDGKIVLESGPELIDHLEEKGYDWIEE
jgi:Fe-S cluster assembly ATP-binding protein